MPFGYSDEDWATLPPEEKQRIALPRFGSSAGEEGDAGVFGIPAAAAEGVGEIIKPTWDDLRGASERDARAEAAEQQRKALGAIDTLEGYMPSVDQLTPEYEQEQVTPDMLLGQSRASTAGADPWSIQAQRMALQQIQDVAAQRGMTGADRARLREGQAQNAMAMRSQREGIAQNAAERGLSGSGVELAGMLGGAQAGANALASENASIQQAAQQRALQAMQAAGGLGSQVRGQSFNEAYNRGAAADAFNRSNVDYRRGVQSRNVGTRNSQQDRGSDAARDVYRNRENIAALRTGQYGQAQQQARQDAEDARKRRQDLITGGIDLGRGAT